MKQSILLPDSHINPQAPINRQSAKEFLYLTLKLVNDLHSELHNENSQSNQSEKLLKLSHELKTKSVTP